MKKKLEIRGESHINQEHTDQKKQFENSAEQQQLILIQEGQNLDLKPSQFIYGVEDPLVSNYSATLRAHTYIVGNLPDFIGFMQNYYKGKIDPVWLGEQQIPTFIEVLDKMVKDKGQNPEVAERFSKARLGFTEVIVEYVRNILALAFEEQSIRDEVCDLLGQQNLLQDLVSYSKKYHEHLGKPLNIEILNSDFFSIFFKNRTKWDNFLKETLLPLFLERIKKEHSLSDNTNVTRKKLNSFLADPFSEEGELHFNEIVLKLRSNIMCNNNLAIIEANPTIQRFAFWVGDDHVEEMKTVFVSEEFLDKISNLNLEIQYFSVQSKMANNADDNLLPGRIKASCNVAPSSTVFKVSADTRSLDSIEQAQMMNVLEGKY